MLPALSTNSNMPSGLGCERSVTELVTQNPGSGVNRRHICPGAAGGEGSSLQPTWALFLFWVDQSAEALGAAVSR